jgi:hypothetical protein
VRFLTLHRFSRILQKSFDENVADNKAALPPCHAFNFTLPTASYHASYTKSADIFF